MRHTFTIFLLFICTWVPVSGSSCTPMNPPTLVSQTISGGDLILEWYGSTTFTCSYDIAVEFACNNEPFTGTGPTWYSAVAISNGVWYPYPLMHVNLNWLCPGTTYKFRAREHFYIGLYSMWTPTYTFTTPGSMTIPTISTSATPALICTGSSAQLNASALTNPCGSIVQYNWTPAAGLSNPSIPNPIATPASTTTYTCTVSGGPMECWSTTSTTTITVLPVAVAGSVTASPGLICPGDTTHLSLSGYTGTIQWQSSPSSAGPWTTIAGATSDNYTASLSASTCFRAAVTGCTTANSNAVCVTVKPSPLITVNSPTVCTGQSAIINASGAGSYSWSTGATGSSLTVSPPATATYTVTGSALGCTSTSVATVTISPYPVITVNSDTICEGESAVLSASGASTYLWSEGSVGTPLIVSPVSNTTYTVTGTSSVCQGTATTFVNLFPPTIADFSCPPTVDAFHPTIDFTGLPQNAVSWSWDFGEPAAGTENSCADLSPAHTYSQSGIYCPSFTVTSSDGCINKISKCLEIEPLFTFYVPNAFSPDGDQLNDGFAAKGNSISSFKLYIYDRWGNLVFDSDNINEAWDGKVKGGSESAQEDVYVYLIELRDQKQKLHQYKGSVTLVR